MSFNQRSKDYLKNELKDCFHDFYVTVLDMAEKQLRPNKKSKEWEFFRFSILNLGNDYIREVDHVLNEYQIEFRPVVFSVEYKDEQKNKIPTSKVATLNFGFSDKDNIPYFSIVSTKNSGIFNDLLDIKEILQCGAVSSDAKSEWYTVFGLYDIFHKIIPFLTSNNVIKGAALERFVVWKEKVYKLEEQSNVKKIT